MPKRNAVKFHLEIGSYRVGQAPLGSLQTQFKLTCTVQRREFVLIDISGYLSVAEGDLAPYPPCVTRKWLTQCCGLSEVEQLQTWRVSGIEIRPQALLSVPELVAYVLPLVAEVIALSPTDTQKERDAVAVYAAMGEKADAVEVNCYENGLQTCSRKMSYLEC